MTTYEDLKTQIRKSKFRSRFHLDEADKVYIAEHGWQVLRSQTERIISARLADAFPKNDGRQTPMRGHPVFKAQHATGCCCRGCLAKWHKIPVGRSLTDLEIQAVTEVVLSWLKEKTGSLSQIPRTPDLFHADILEDRINTGC